MIRRLSLPAAMGLLVAFSSCRLTESPTDFSRGGDASSAEGGAGGVAGASGGGNAGTGAVGGAAAGAGAAGAGIGGHGGTSPAGGAGAGGTLGGFRPPGRPVGDASPSGKGVTLTFAARRFYLGSIDPVTDNADADAWRAFGFDYDGECTMLEQSQQDLSSTCEHPSSANAASLEDGDGCRDNTAGHFLSEILQFASPSAESQSHMATMTGAAATIILQIEDVDVGPEDPYAPGRVYVSAPTQEGLLWDGNDVLDVDASSVSAALESPLYEFPNGYIQDNTWVSHELGGPPVEVPMWLVDRVVVLPMTAATLTAKLADDHTTVLDGMFAGVLDLQSVEPAVAEGFLEIAECNAAIANLSTQMLLSNRDLGSAPAFVTPGEVCDLTSFGVGVEWKVVRAPQNVVDVASDPGCGR